MQVSTGQPEEEASRPSRFYEVARLFAKLGIIGFGGPPAHVALMEDEAVRRRGWVERQHFLHALSVTNMIPGPNSTEMAIHLGYLRAGVPAGIAAGILFILPAFLLMLLLSWVYFEYGATPSVDAIFYGVKPVVMAIIAGAVWRTGRTAVTDLKLAAIFAGGVALTLLEPSLEPLFLLVAGLAGIALYAGFAPFGKAMPALVLLSPVPPLLAWQGDTLIDLTLLFLRAGGLLFGGGFVMIPLIQHDVVNHFGWMTEQEFLDGIALGQSTPGPIVITATFVGYKAAGLAGAVVATVAIFLPAFTFALASARFLQTASRWPVARAFLKGVGAGVVGAIFAVAITLGNAALVDLFTVILALAAVVAIVRFRTDSTYLLAAGGLLGLLVKEAL